MSMIFYVAAIAVLGLIAFLGIRQVIHEDVVGHLLIVHQDNEPDVYMLEVFKGKTDRIKPGEIVSLVVHEEHITQK